ncbi:MAG TPA: glycosyltransferase family 39 protein [Blastocatellia bacterium]|nr:glycosyltransferase family 39 protein [Blastocatellia bacterium]
MSPASGEMDEHEPDAGGKASARHHVPWVRPGIVLVIILASAVSVYVALLTPDSFGDYNDDAIYLTTAKALATGQGYRIISLPDRPAQTKYPPFYPFVLSLIWRVFPRFPGNVTAMMLFSVLASAASTILAWGYMATRGYASRWVALVPAGLAAINGYTVLFSTGVFSEMPYMALSVAALLLAESREKSSVSWTTRASGGIALGVLMGLAFLTRVTGLTLVVAVALYFVLNKKTWKAFLPVGTAAIFMVSWAGWCSRNREVSQKLNAVYFTNYPGYAFQLIRNSQIRGHHSLLVAICLVIKSNTIDLLVRSTPLTTVGLYHDWLESLSAARHGFLLACLQGLALLLIVIGARKHAVPRLRLILIYITLYLLVHLLLPYPDSTYERYLVPILPFLVLFLVTGIGDTAKALFSELRRPGRPARRIVSALAVLPLGMLTGLGLASYGLSLRSAVADLKPGWAATMEEENAPLMNWIKTNTEDTAVVVCVHHAMYYLYTGRRATLSFSTERLAEAEDELRPDDSVEIDHGEDDSEDSARASEGLRRILAQNRADYLVVTASDVNDKTGGVDFASATAEFTKRGLLRQVFTTPNGESTVYRVSVDAGPGGMAAEKFTGQETSPTPIKKEAG